MKNICTIFALCLSTSVFAIDFNCSNAPKSVWGKYYSISASTADFKSLQVYSFGLVEGSQSAEEEEPVNTIEDFTSHPDLKEMATSAQWKKAIPFDLSSENLGKATLYLHAQEFASSHGETIARLKINDKDIRLTCRY